MRGLFLPVIRQYFFASSSSLPRLPCGFVRLSSCAWMAFERDVSTGWILFSTSCSFPTFFTPIIFSSQVRSILPEKICVRLYFFPYQQTCLLSCVLAIPQ